MIHGLYRTSIGIDCYYPGSGKVAYLVKNQGTVTIDYLRKRKRTARFHETPDYYTENIAKDYVTVRNVFRKRGITEPGVAR